MKNLFVLMVILFGLYFSSCGGGEEKTGVNDDASPEISQNDNKDEVSNNSENSSSEPANLQEAMKEAEKAIKESGLQQKEPINFRELQKFTPEKLAGMERTSKSGETAGALGMKMSNAEAKYKDSDGNIIEVKVVDTGGFAMGLMGMAAWASAEIDKEDENGYERTSTVDGHKAFEKCRNSSKTCELSIIAKNRYVVSANCRNCGIEKLKETVKEMGLDDLPSS